MKEETGRRERVESVDLLRGLVMVLMALDHVRDFFSSYGGNPTDATSVSGLMFFTRWVTHLCAPTFVFLAGTSIYLQAERKPRGQLARFLVTRGLWLMALELVVVTSMLTFHPNVHVLLFQVIWVTGVSMLVMAALIYLPLWAVAAFGSVLVLGHNLLDPIQPAEFGAMGGVVWRLLHVPGMLVPPATGHFLINLYPLIPWPGIMALGFVFGALLRSPPRERQRSMLLLGAGSLVAFAVVRAINGYGNPIRWKHLTSPGQTFMSFMDVQKYPPSLLYVLATLGVSLVLMAGFDRWAVADRWRALRSVLVVFGRVPFFYYVLHFTTVHFAALLVTAAMGLNWRWWITLPPAGGIFVGKPEGFGFSLATVYLIWVAVVIFCYFPCRWFAGVKQRGGRWWLSYL